MGFSTKIVSNIETIFSWFLSGVIKKNLEDYCHINTANSEHNLITDNGSFLSVIKIYGNREVSGKEQIKNLENAIPQILQSSFLNEGHKIQFVFTRDNERTESEINDIVLPYKNASKNLGFDFDDIYAGKKLKLKKLCAYESAYMVLTTDLESAKESVDYEKAEIIKKTKDSSFAVNGQNYENIFTSVENNHTAFVNKILDGFSSQKINIEIMEVKKAIRDIKKLINNDMVDKKWEPILAGDVLTLVEENDISLNENDISNIIWPKISRQIFPDESEKIENDILKIGDKYISPLTFSLPPQRVLEFNELVRSINKEIPWQISISIRSPRIQKINLKSITTNLTAWSNSDNILIKRGLDEIKEKIENKDTVVELAIDALTWADNVIELKKRRSILMKFLQGWGTATVELAKGDINEAVLSVMPAITKEPYGNIAYAPLEDIVKMLPLTRPSHVWESGAMLFKTDDSKLFPYQPGSSLQNAWNYLYFATPGSGKSVLLNAINLANVSTLGLSDFPFIGILDIGISSSGFIEMLRDILPENLKHIAITEKLKNTSEYAINILDTQIGSRKPSIEDVFFIANTITLAISPTGKEAYDSVESMVTQIIEKTYEHFSDKNEPKIYKKYINEKIDIELEKLNMEIIEDETTWWEVTDFLFKNKKIELSKKAQRNAVPIISDLVYISQTNQSIRNSYEEVKIPTGENLIQYFNRSIGEMVVQYPMLSKPTVFDISSAKIISLDLQNVAPEGEGAAKKQTSLMYMIGRHILTKNFFIDEEIKKNSPKIYHKFQQSLIDNLRETPKIISYDEFHRTSGVEIVRKQVLRDMREGRKWRMQVNLVSQLLDDFDKEMIEMSDGTFILSGGESTNEIVRKFNLNETMENILRTRITGPSSNGTPFIFKFKTKKGTYSQFLYAALSPIELWAFNTTAEDCALRKKLSNIVGQKQARILLAKTFPNGSAKAHMEKMLEEDKNGSINAIEEIIKKILEKNNIFI